MPTRGRTFHLGMSDSKLPVNAQNDAHCPSRLLERLTARLRLVALSEPQLQRLLTDPVGLERELGLGISRSLLNEVVRRAITIKLEKIARAPIHQHPWYTYWLVVVRAEHFGAGLAGFKGAPGIPQEVEIGYGIDAAQGRRGITTEAIGGLVAWAFSMPGCAAVTAETRLDNLASQRVLEKNGFRLVRRECASLFWRLDKE